jgi:hypothetical protein
MGCAAEQAVEWMRVPTHRDAGSLGQRSNTRRPAADARVESAPREKPFDGVGAARDEMSGGSRGREQLVDDRSAGAGAERFVQGRRERLAKLVGSDGGAERHAVDVSPLSDGV